MSVRQFKYYNQNNYGNVPYPSPTLPRATVKSGGCGVVCASMIVSNLTNKTVAPSEMAKYAINKKARVAGGTDMNILAKALRQDYGLHFTTTSNESILLDHLKSGGMAVANVGGNRKGYTGVFSDSGHYIVVAGLESDGRLIILDPGFYPGKFNLSGRVGKVKVVGNYCITDINVLGKDTENRTPSYWLFQKVVSNVDWKKQIIDDAIKAGIITESHNPDDVATKWFVLAVILNMMKIGREIA